MFKKEMSIKEFIEQPEIKTLIEKGMMTVNAIDEQEEIIDENVDEEDEIIQWSMGSLLQLHNRW